MWGANRTATSGGLCWRYLSADLHRTRRSRPAGVATDVSCPIPNGHWPKTRSAGRVANLSERCIRAGRARQHQAIASRSPVATVWRLGLVTVCRPWRRSPARPRNVRRCCRNLADAEEVSADTGHTLATNWRCWPSDTRCRRRNSATRQSASDSPGYIASSHRASAPTEPCPAFPSTIRSCAAAGGSASWRLRSGITEFAGQAERRSPP